MEKHNEMLQKNNIKMLSDKPHVETYDETDMNTDIDADIDVSTTTKD